MIEYTLYLRTGQEVKIIAESYHYDSQVYRFVKRGIVIAEVQSNQIIGHQMTKADAIDGASLRDPHYFAECMVKALQTGHPALDQELRWRVGPLAPFEEKA